MQNGVCLSRSGVSTSNEYEDVWQQEKEEARQGKHK